MASALIAPSFKNISLGLAGLVLALSCFFAAAPAAHANTVCAGPKCVYSNGLTEQQVSSLLNLLSAFGADQSVIDNVSSILRGGSSGCNSSDMPCIQPVFTANPSSGTAPLSVSFTGTVNSAGYSIDFGDGSTSGDVRCGNGACPSTPAQSSVNTSHTYQAQGIYTAKLRQNFTSNAGNCFGVDCNVVATKVITVSGTAGPSCTVSLSSSTIARNSGNTLGITWSSQNAVSRTYKGYTSSGSVYYSSPQIAVSGSLQDTSFNNLAPGNYTRIDTVAGANGATATCSTHLTIVDSSQNATFSATPTSGQAPLSVTFAASNMSGPVQGYNLSFGDGTSGNAWDGGVQQSNTFFQSHTYTQAGTYTAILREPLDGRVVGTQTITVWPCQGTAGSSCLPDPSVSFGPPTSASMVAAVAAAPLSLSADSLNLLADQITEVNYAIAGVLSSYVALFSPDVPQAAAAASAPMPMAPIAGGSLAATLAYMPQSLYETVGKTTDFLAAVEMAPVHVVSDALSEALFQAGIY